MLSNFPYLLNVNLELKPSNDEGYILFASCNCSEDTYNIGPFSVRVFLRKFFLELQLESTYSPQESWFANELKPALIDIEYEVTSSSEETDATENSASLGLQSAGLGTLNLAGQQTTENKRNRSEKAAYAARQALVSASGSEQSPRWVFINAPHEACLSGPLLSDTQLCKLYGQERVKAIAKAVIPRYGVFTSPSRYATVKEQRVLNIFALLVRKSITKHKHDIEILKK